MIERELPPTPAFRISSLHLDYGADTHTCSDELSVDLSERGIRLKSHWHFDIGSQLSLAFVDEQSRLGRKRFAVEGTVVFCEPDAECDGIFESALLFLDLPEETRLCVKELSLRLEAAKEAAAAEE